MTSSPCIRRGLTARSLRSARRSRPSRRGLFRATRTRSFSATTATRREKRRPRAASAFSKSSISRCAYCRCRARRTRTSSSRKTARTPSAISLTRAPDRSNTGCATWRRKTRPRPTRGAWTISRARLRFWRHCRARSSARYTPRAWRKRRAYRARRCCRRPNGCAAAALPTRKSGKRATPPAPRRRRSPRSAPSGTTIRARRARRKA